MLLCAGIMAHLALPKSTFIDEAGHPAWHIDEMAITQED